MKVGLITFHDTTNFGSLLQTYGLYKGIENLGHECEVIDYQCKSICDRELPKANDLKSGLKSFVRHLLFDEKKQKYQQLHDFLTSNMKLSVRCCENNKNELKDKYDKFVVGSDIVWGTDITGGDTTYFLDFVDDSSKKYAYSSSVGNEWNADDKIKLKPYLSDFKGIAVREEESAQWVSELTGNKPEVVCDPTMLLHPSEWLRFVTPRSFKDEYVLVYFDSPKNECLKTAVKYAKANGLKVFFINYGRPYKGTKTVRPYKLEDFMSLIYYAERVFTASYHGLLFSVYFNKPFLYFNRSHKSRMNTLAGKLGISSCDGNQVDIENLPDLDYAMVNGKVEQYRQDSIEVLKRFLSE